MSKRARPNRAGEINELGNTFFHDPEEPAELGSAPERTEQDESGRQTSTDRGSAAPGIAPGSVLRRHPATISGSDRRARRDVFDLDPRRILERGPYIREWDEEGEEFERLAASIAARREVDTPIWVRSEGPTGQRRFILVAGKGRLKAALRNDLPLVPVRDLGELTDQEAIARQAEENLHRRNMSPGETAYALWLMHTYGESVTEIARRVQRDKGYVSYMVRVGEAIQELTPSERHALTRRGALQVRHCQAIAALGSVGERVAELQRLLSVPVEMGGAAPQHDDPDQSYRRPDPTARHDPELGAQATSPVERAARRRATVDASPFYGKAIRHGRTFRMRWVQDDLRRDPAAIAEGFVAALRAEGEQLLAALDRLETAVGTDGSRSDRAAIARARGALQAILPR